MWIHLVLCHPFWNPGIVTTIIRGAVRGTRLSMGSIMPRPLPPPLVRCADGSYWHAACNLVALQIFVGRFRFTFYIFIYLFISIQELKINRPSKYPGPETPHLNWPDVLARSVSVGYFYVPFFSFVIFFRVFFPMFFVPKLFFSKFCSFEANYFAVGSGGLQKPVPDRLFLRLAWSGDLPYHHTVGSSFFSSFLLFLEAFDARE